MVTTQLLRLYGRTAPLRKYMQALRDGAVRNPPLPVTCREVLFVCLGNICRSPFGARLMQARADALAIPLRCTSAGFVPSKDGRSPDDAIHVASRFGVTLSDHRPIALTIEQIDAADCVFAMEMAQLRRLRRTWPDRSHKFFVLAPFEPMNHTRSRYDAANIPDPFGKGEAAFDATYSRIAAAVDGFLTALATRSSSAGFAR